MTQQPELLKAKGNVQRVTIKVEPLTEEERARLDDTSGVWRSQTSSYKGGLGQILYVHFPSKVKHITAHFRALGAEAERVLVRALGFNVLSDGMDGFCFVEAIDVVKYIHGGDTVLWKKEFPLRLDMWVQFEQ